MSTFYAKMLDLSEIISVKDFGSIKNRLFNLSYPEPNTGCYIWGGATYLNGYGILTINKKCLSAHRVSYYVHKGNIGYGLVVDHLCNNKLCINPEHLQATTQKKNVLRGNSGSAKNSIKTHCYKGHEFTKENTRINNRGSRDCIICHKDKKKRYYKKHIAAILENKAEYYKKNRTRIRASQKKYKRKK